MGLLSSWSWVVSLVSLRQFLPLLCMMWVVSGCRGVAGESASVNDDCAMGSFDGGFGWVSVAVFGFG